MSNAKATYPDPASAYGPIRTSDEHTRRTLRLIMGAIASHIRASGDSCCRSESATMIERRAA